MGSCLCMDSETVSAARAPTWERGGTENPKGQKYQGADAAAVVVPVGGVGGGVGGRLKASFLSTN